MLNLLNKRSPAFWIFLSLGFIIFTNQLHYFYQDEFENILGGRYLLSLRFPYADFFTHHNPGAFFLSGVINILSGESFVRFRILLGIVFLASYITFYLYVKKRFGNLEAKLLLIFYFFITFGATFFWGHMLLADSLSAYLLTPAYMICLLLALKGEALTKKDIYIVSALTFSTILTSLTQAYSCFLIYIFLTVWNFKFNTFKWRSFFLITLLPYLVFVIYLLVSRSIIEYFRQAIEFNAQYYVQLPDNVSPKNPLRVAVVFIVKFFENFKSAFLQVKDVSIGAPFIHALVLSNVSLMIYLGLKRKFYLLTFVFIFLAFINARGNPYTTSETDYQAIVYHFISIFNGLLAMYLLWKEANFTQLPSKRFLLNALILLLGIYQIALFLLFVDKWQDKTYRKYMGTQALIYDRPTIAAALNDLIPKNEHYLIAPFDFENQIYMKSKPATKYIVILPGMDKSERIQSEVLADLKKNKPKILVFNTELSIYQAYPGQFLQNFIKEEYINLAAMGVPCNGFNTKQKWYGDYDFERHFFLDKSKKDTIWNQMLEKGYLYPISQEEVKKIPLCNPTPS